MHPNKPPTSAFPTETTTTTSGLILLMFTACTFFFLFLSYFAELVFLLTPDFTGVPPVSLLSTELHHLPTPLQRQFGEAHSVEACSSTPKSQHDLSIKLKGDFAWYFFYDNGKWH